MTDTTALTQKVNHVYDLIQRSEKSFIASLGNSERFQKFVAAAKLEMMERPELLDASAPSLVKAYLKAAQYDIMPGLGMAHLIPYKKKKKDQRTGQWIVEETVINFQLGYQGLRAYLYKVHPDIVIRAREVREGEVFEVDYGSETITHKPNFQKRGKIYGYYGFTHFRGSLIFKYMSVEELEEHAQKYSEAYRRDLRNKEAKCPWSTDRHAMCLKTMVIQVGNELPKEERNLAELFQTGGSAIINKAGEEEPEWEAEDFGKEVKPEPVKEEDVVDVEPEPKKKTPTPAPKKTVSKKTPEKEPDMPPEEEDESEGVFGKELDDAIFGGKDDLDTEIDFLIKTAMERGITPNGIARTIKFITGTETVKKTETDENKRKVINAIEELMK